MNKQTRNRPCDEAINELSDAELRGVSGGSGVSPMPVLTEVTTKSKRVL
jgi:hypothetical protein